jgi:hypothetical protein
MKARFYTFKGRDAFPGVIFIRFYGCSGIKYLFENIPVTTLLNGTRPMFFTTQPATGYVSKNNLMIPHNIPETERYFIKKPLCH